MSRLTGCYPGTRFHRAAGTALLVLSLAPPIGGAGTEGEAAPGAIVRFTPAELDPMAKTNTKVKPKAKRVVTRIANQAAAYDPTERYDTRQVEGWTVLVNRGLLQNEPALAGRTLELLRHQLYQVVRRVPAGPLERIQSIRIWVEEQEPHHPCMAYHPGRAWLRRNGMNPDKARCVEISNARNFLRWTIDQPWMVLHELAHGYHHQFLAGGYANAAIRAAYERARADKRYDSVSRINGRDDTAYALTNPMEYFAEGSEAFFGTNDFYPYVRSELGRHDPDLFALLKSLWHEGPG